MRSPAAARGPLAGPPVLVVLCLLCFTGCTTLRTLEDATPVRIQDAVEVGDRVRVDASNGKAYYLEVTKVEADSLTGKADNGKHYRIRYSAITEIRVERLGLLQTFVVSAGVGYVLAVAAVLVLFHNLDIHFGVCE